jgi:hypothetical protein
MIFQRYGSTCGICGEVVKREDATLDHVIPGRLAALVPPRT